MGSDPAGYPAILRYTPDGQSSVFAAHQGPINVQDLFLDNAGNLLVAQGFYGLTRYNPAGVRSNVAIPRNLSVYYSTFDKNGTFYFSAYDGNNNGNLSIYKLSADGTPVVVINNTAGTDLSYQRPTVDGFGNVYIT